MTSFGQRFSYDFPQNSHPPAGLITFPLLQSLAHGHYAEPSVDKKRIPRKHSLKNFLLHACQLENRILHLCFSIAVLNLLCKEMKYK